jgi:hypothetical protein
VFAVGQLGREQRAMQLAEEAERAFLEECVMPRGSDADVRDQMRWFQYRVLTFHVRTLEASLNLWGACGWDSKVIARDSTDAGHSERSVFSILCRAHDGPAPGIERAVQRLWSPEERRRRGVRP